MAKFYFTYGSDGHDYVGGWTEVEAEDYAQACDLFCLIHHRSKDGFINCAGIYNEEDFQNTTMYENGNFGKFLHERIHLIVERYD